MGGKQIAAGPGEEVSDSLHESQELFTQKKLNKKTISGIQTMKLHCQMHVIITGLTHGFPKDPLDLGPVV